jgi:uncharacterized membrane protein YraQ (UPF0718 family)
MKNIRDILAIFWSAVCAIIIFYVIVRFGDKMEILTLMIGTISGTIIGGIFGHYFSSTHKQNFQNSNIDNLSVSNINGDVELEDFWVIQSKVLEPTLYVAGVMPTEVEGLLEPIKSAELSEAIHYKTEELANQAIASLFDYSNWISIIPKRKPNYMN